MNLSLPPVGAKVVSTHFIESVLPHRIQFVCGVRVCVCVCRKDASGKRGIQVFKYGQRRERHERTLCSTRFAPALLTSSWLPSSLVSSSCSVLIRISSLVQLVELSPCCPTNHEVALEGFGQSHSLRHQGCRPTGRSSRASFILLCDDCGSSCQIADAGRGARDASICRRQ